MCKIELNDTTMSIMMKMSEGNPGAVSALIEIMQKHDEIDPQALMGPIGAIMILDTWKIYGTDIYVLFSDKCNRDVRKMLMLMRATQLGLFSQSKLQQMAKDQMHKINLTDEEFNELDEKVCTELKEFQKAA